MRKYSYIFFLTFCCSLASEPLTKKTYNDMFIFMQGLLKNPHIVGALSPSSVYVAQELIKPLAAHKGPKHILEVGAGTGQITKTIVQYLSPEDSFDVVELNEDFCKVLVDQFGNYQQVNIFCGSILDWNPEKKYDFIICTLPFNRFSIDLVKLIIDHISFLAQPAGYFSYIELRFLALFKRFILSAHELKQQELVSAYMQKFNHLYCKQTSTVFRNFPPAQVLHCQFASAETR